MFAQQNWNIDSKINTRQTKGTLKPLKLVPAKFNNSSLKVVVGLFVAF